MTITKDWYYIAGVWVHIQRIGNKIYVNGKLERIVEST